MLHSLRRYGGEPSPGLTTKSATSASVVPVTVTGVPPAVAGAVTGVSCTGPELSGAASPVTRPSGPPHCALSAAQVLGQVPVLRAASWSPVPHRQARPSSTAASPFPVEAQIVLQVCGGGGGRKPAGLLK